MIMMRAPHRLLIRLRLDDATAEEESSIGAPSVFSSAFGFLAHTSFLGVIIDDDDDATAEEEESSIGNATKGQRDIDERRRRRDSGGGGVLRKDACLRASHSSAGCGIDATTRTRYHEMRRRRIRQWRSIAVKVSVLREGSGSNSV